MKRTATAIWKGTGKDGKGTLTTQSTTLNNTQWSTFMTALRAGSHRVPSPNMEAKSQHMGLK